MADEMKAYTESRAAFERAKREAERIAAVVVDAGQKLRAWNAVQVSNMSAGGYSNMPLHSPSINANEWPSAADIHAALTAYHEAHFQMRLAYDAIPEEVRVSAKPPESK
jgi:hypothetical protein